MASSLHDPQMSRSLWLQRRSRYQTACRAQWRTDWTPIGLLVLFLSILILVSVFLPSSETVEKVKQAARGQESGSQLPVVGVLRDP
jgi:hypothetical protein